MKQKWENDDDSINHSWLVIIFCVQADAMWLVVALFSLCGALELSYDVADGTKANSYIANLPQDAGISIGPAQNGHFSIVMGGEFLKVNPKNGDLRTADDIDREKICTNYDEECLVDIEVIITPRFVFYNTAFNPYCI